MIPKKTSRHRDAAPQRPTALLVGLLPGRRLLVGLLPGRRFLVGLLPGRRLLVGLLLIAGLFIGCSFDYRDSRLSDSLAEEVPNSVLKSYEHTSVRDGDPAFTVSAETSRIFQEKHEARLEKVRFEEYDETGEAVARGTAEHATVFTRSDNVELEGEINFTHLPEDFVISAEYLYWNNEERSLEGRKEQSVHIRRSDGSTIDGRSFSTSGAYRRIQFDGGVKGSYEGEEGPKSFSFSGDSTTIVMQKDRRRTLLSGNARISSEEMEINADTIELYGEDFRFARCSGDVETEETAKELHLTSEKLFYDREKEILRIEGYNEMVDMQNELVAKSGYLEHRSREDVTIFQIGVRILKATDETKMVCRSEFARYDREHSRLTLSGMPVVEWKEDVYRATRIIVNLDSDEIRMEGDVEGTVTSEKEEEKEEAE